MGFLEILFIGFGLSMDAFAVSVTSGIIMNEVKRRNACKIAAFFGVFQGVMPLIGWALGINFKEYIVSIDHWVAFILLGIIGGNMVLGALKGEDDDKGFDPMNNKVLLLLAIATSIDALAVGVSFAFLSVNIWSAVVVIGATTFILSFIGVMVGKKAGEVLKKRAELCGGLVLVLIGLKILMEHTGATQAVINMLH